jgi:hypothetical protein
MCFDGGMSGDSSDSLGLERTAGRKPSARCSLALHITQAIKNTTSTELDVQPPKLFCLLGFLLYEVK